MPRMLFIRVLAATYDEKEVPRTWPLVYAAVWPDKELEGVESPAKLARKLVPGVNRGVLELAQEFVELVRFGTIADANSELRTIADTLENLRNALDDALGNRDVRSAEATCAAIEDTLDSAEKLLR